jgi:Phytanoyl-CoA dioxygenase (PhyH)
LRGSGRSRIVYSVFAPLRITTFKMWNDCLSSYEPGYRIEETILPAEECDAIGSGILNFAMIRGRAGARHLMRVPEVARVATDGRLLSIARRELRTEPVPFRATLFEKTGKANWLVVWHQDTALPLRERCNAPGWGPWSVKADVLYAHAPAWALSQIVALRVHLDASNSNNGALRLVPRSHVLGVMSDHGIAHVVNEYGFVECTIPRGGILTMSPLIIHSSSKALVDAPRRVLHLEYAAAQSLGEGIELAIA